jgi:glycine cleavage system H protein
MVGITDYAQDLLGDVLFVDRASEGDSFAKGEVFAEVESEKTSSELTLPFAGEVVKVNEELDDSPELLRRSVCKLDCGIFQWKTCPNWIR